jgi:N utilization substance protein B
MANRHLSRSIAMQTLFEWDFNSEKNPDIEDILGRNMREFGPGLEDQEFVKKLVTGVSEKKKKIDAIIGKTAPEWPLKQIALIDRNVLRLGLYELLFGNRKEVPPKVAINEAIELAKTFGGETSGKFVNGVLGTVYRELGEPGKDEKPKEVEQKEVPLEKLGGAVVYRKDNEKLLFALVHDVFGYWTLSKGRLEEGEDEKAGTIREINEELGIVINLSDKLGVNEYVASHPEKGPVKKHVTYFLAQTKEKELTLGDSGGLDDARWFREDELDDLKIYEDIRPILETAISKIKTK